MKSRNIKNTPKRLGCVTRAGLILIPCLLIILVVTVNWNDLQTTEGRQKLATETVALLRSEDIYIVGLIVILNVWIYSAITSRLYPSGSHVMRGIGHALMLVAGTDQDPGDVRDTMAELKHFFLIFILPFILITAGIAEYRITKKLLHQAVGMSQPAVMENVEQPAGGDG